VKSIDVPINAGIGGNNANQSAFFGGAPANSPAR
jgi:hypothetical protein